MTTTMTVTASRSEVLSRRLLAVVLEAGAAVDGVAAGTVAGAVAGAVAGEAILANCIVR